MIAKEKVTITLPKDLMDELRAIAPNHEYSQFIAEAIEFFIKERRRQELQERLIYGYQANAEADFDLAAKWSAVEDESWLLHSLPYDLEEPTNDESP